MPGTTTNLGLRYPVGSDAPDGPGAVSQLAADVDGYLRVGGAEYVANSAALTAIPSARLFTGKLAYQADVDSVFRWNGTAWVVRSGDGTTGIIGQGTVANDSTTNVSSVVRDGLSCALNLAVKTGGNTLAQNAQVVTVGAGYGGVAGGVQTWHNVRVLDASYAMLGTAMLSMTGTVLAFYAYVTNAGAVATTLPANLKLFGDVRYRAAA